MAVHYLLKSWMALHNIKHTRVALRRSLKWRLCSTHYRPSAEQIMVGSVNIKVIDVVSIQYTLSSHAFAASFCAEDGWAILFRHPKKLGAHARVTHSSFRECLKRYTNVICFDYQCNKGQRGRRRICSLQEPSLSYCILGLRGFATKETWVNPWSTIVNNWAEIGSTIPDSGMKEAKSFNVPHLLLDFSKRTIAQTKALFREYSDSTITRKAWWTGGKKTVF